MSAMHLSDRFWNGEIPSGESGRARRLLLAALKVHGGESAVRALQFVRMRGTWLFVDRGQVIRQEEFGLHAGSCGNLRAHFCGPRGDRQLVAGPGWAWVWCGPDRRALPVWAVRHGLFELNPNLGLFNPYLEGRLRLPWDPRVDETGRATRLCCCLGSPTRSAAGRAVQGLVEVRLEGPSLRVSGLAVFRAANSFLSAPVETLSFSYADFRCVDRLLVPFRIRIRNRERTYALVTLDDFRRADRVPDPGDSPRPRLGLQWT